MMRKLAIAGALAAATLAWAQGVRADDARTEEQKKVSEARTEAQKEKAEASKDVQEAKADAQEKAAKADAEARKDINEARKDAREDMRDDRQAADRRVDANDRNAMGMNRGDKKHPLFDGKDNFNVDGKVQKVSRNTITLSRMDDELPAATLTISKDTKIEVDGERATLAQIRQGQDVKASFNLRGDKAEAVEVKVDRK